MAEPSVTNLRRASTAVYLACEESVAADISNLLRWAADEIERLSQSATPQPGAQDAVGEALKWYADEAEAAARYMAQGKATTADALLAILTVLANDGGARARAALQSARGSEGE